MEFIATRVRGKEAGAVLSFVQASGEEVYLYHFFSPLVWRDRGSNPRHPEFEIGTLPTALLIWWVDIFKVAVEIER